MQSLLLPGSIIDPEPSRTIIEQCNTNVDRFFLDAHFRNLFLSYIDDEMDIKEADIESYSKIVKLLHTPCNSVLIKLHSHKADEERTEMGTTTLIASGSADCVYVNNEMCPMIFQYINGKITIGHESMHIHQQLKESYFPFDYQLTAIDRKFIDRESIVSKIICSFGIEKAYEYAIQKPSVFLLEEAEAWWRFYKNENPDTRYFIWSYSVLGVGQFNGLMDIIEAPPSDESLDEMIRNVIKYINFIGTKDYYCSRIVTLLNRKNNKNYNLAEWIMQSINEIYESTDYNKLEDYIKGMM